MSLADVVKSTQTPLTFDLLVEQLQACGLSAGETVLVHSRMSALGWVVGGAVDVIRALQHILTHDGTLMMPTHSTSNTDPSNWQNPAVPSAWHETIRAHRPAFDPAWTPTRMMGTIPELFRTLPNVIRSEHPIGSFAAWGKHADTLTANHHDLSAMFGEESPIGKLYELDGYILLLGVPHENNTSLHLAEHRADFPGKKMISEGTAVMVDGQRQWVDFEMLDLETDDFNTIGTAYEQANHIPIHKVGNAEVRFMKQRPLVDFATQWMTNNRDFTK